MGAVEATEPLKGLGVAELQVLQPESMRPKLERRLELRSLVWGAKLALKELVYVSRECG